MGVGKRIEKRSYRRAEGQTRVLRRVHQGHIESEEKKPVDQREGAEDGRELSKDRVPRKVITVKDNYIVIRMEVGLLTVGYKLAEGNGLREG